MQGEGYEAQDQSHIATTPKPLSRQVVSEQIIERKLKCEVCGFEGEMEVKKRHGCASYSWMGCLLLFTGVMFWLPLVLKNCMDSVTVCPGCEHELQREYGDCV